MKTEKFKNERYIGDPINAVRIFNQKEVDELVLFDIDSTNKQTPINFNLLEQIASECFMPMCYGGGVKTMAAFRKLFSMGIEKVSVSSLLFEKPDIIKEAVSVFGSQSIVATLDVKQSRFRKKYVVCTHSSKNKIKMSPVEAAQYARELGVGEIILNTVHRDGTWSGFDSNLIKQVVDSVNIPVVACGGAGSLGDIKSVIDDANPSAVAIGSMAVFQSKDMGVLIKFPSHSELSQILI